VPRASQGPDADAMPARPAGDVLDARAGGAVTDEDAVVAAGGRGAGDEDVRVILDVDAVGVGALRRGTDGQAADHHAAAAVEPDVELRAGLHLQPLHRHVVAQEKPYSLATNRSS
jgi:hypothetical protein